MSSITDDSGVICKSNDIQFQNTCDGVTGFSSIIFQIEGANQPKGSYALLVRPDVIMIDRSIPVDQLSCMSPVQDQFLKSRPDNPTVLE